MRKTYTGFDKVRTVRQGDDSVTYSFDRGFTGHEHLYGFGLINMNGRMYDPVMSSFLSVDRFMQNPLSAQEFNPYAYCMYNPLRYVDPTGWAPRPGGGNGPDNPPYVVIDGWTSGFMLPEVTVTPYEERPTTFTEFVYTPYSGGGGGGESNYGNPNDTPTFSQGGGSGGGGGNHGSTSNPSPNNADNIDIASKVLITTNLYTTIESALYYNRLTRTWRDKLDIFRSFDFHGNQNTGGLNSYGKAMSNKFANVGSVLGFAGAALSFYQFEQATTVEGKLEYSFDTFWGLAGAIVPGLFGMPTTIWFLGGKQVTIWYGRTTVVPMIKQGINPGEMINQPFK